MAVAALHSLLPKLPTQNRDQSAMRHEAQTVLIMARPEQALSA